MTKSRRLRIGLRVLGAAGIVLVLLCLATSTVVYRDCAFVCENTGSRKGYCESFFGWKTNNWYEASALETFMQEHYPEELKHRWISYMGTGKNLFGVAVSSRHGRPGPILTFPRDMFEYYVHNSDDQKIRSLYELLDTGNVAAIEAKLDQITKELCANPRK
jgi:hypothetical protein